MRAPSAPIWRGGSIVDHAPGGSEFGIETVLVVHAHPGDEVFATGATVLAAKAAGHGVVLRQLTGGEGRTARLTSQGLRDTRRRSVETAT
jgi:LmbE family N-acetylglucosaminyl deacetylase